MYDNFRNETCLRYSRKYVTEETWYTPAADNMKKVCTDIPKWKYLSGISKEQRAADLLAEAAAKEAAAAAEEEEAAAEEEEEEEETALALETTESLLSLEDENEEMTAVI